MLLEVSGLSFSVPSALTCNPTRTFSITADGYTFCASVLVVITISIPEKKTVSGFGVEGRRCQSRHTCGIVTHDDAVQSDASGEFSIEDMQRAMLRGFWQ